MKNVYLLKKTKEVQTGILLSPNLIYIFSPAGVNSWLLTELCCCVTQKTYKKSFVKGTSSIQKSLFLHSSTVLLLFELSIEPRTTAAKQGTRGQGHELLQLICLQTEREAEVEVVILRKFLSSLNVNFSKQN